MIYIILNDFFSYCGRYSQPLGKGKSMFLDISIRETVNSLKTEKVSSSTNVAKSIHPLKQKIANSPEQSHNYSWTRLHDQIGKRLRSGQNKLKDGLFSLQVEGLAKHNLERFQLTYMWQMI